MKARIWATPCCATWYPSLHDHKYQRSLADRGAFIEYDMIGMDYFYADQQAQFLPATRRNAIAICKLVEDGHLNSVLMSQDVFLKMMLTRYGGFGYGYILKHFVAASEASRMISRPSIMHSRSKTRAGSSPRRIARSSNQREGSHETDKRYKILLAGELLGHDGDPHQGVRTIRRR